VGNKKRKPLDPILTMKLPGRGPPDKTREGYRKKEVGEALTRLAKGEKRWGDHSWKLGTAVRWGVVGHEAGKKKFYERFRGVAVRGSAIPLRLGGNNCQKNGGNNRVPAFVLGAKRNYECLGKGTHQ